MESEIYNNTVKNVVFILYKKDVSLTQRFVQIFLSSKRNIYICKARLMRLFSRVFRGRTTAVVVWRGVGKLLPVHRYSVDPFS